MGRMLRSALLCECAALTLLLSVPAQAEAGAAGDVRQLVIPAPAGDGSGINPTARTVSLTVPARNGAANLGDIIVEIDPDDSVRVSVDRLLQLLSPLVAKETLDSLRAGHQPNADDFARAGVAIRYNSRDLALDLVIAAERLAARSINLAQSAVEPVGEFLRPASASAYLNARGNFDYLHGDGGAQSPLIYLDGAARIAGVVAEGEAFWTPGAAGQEFRRIGSRFVYDDRERLVRWTAGDLQPLGRGFQALPEIAGISVGRTYGLLEPQRIARPRGSRAFSLSRPSTVEVLVNGQLLRRLQLDAGNYDLRDFPFAQGANDVRLVVIDDAGRRELLGFNMFFDQSQLEAGLTEFGAYAGVLAPSGAAGPVYSDELAFTGFVRRGINDRLTIGANLQGDGQVQMGGAEAIVSTRLGTLAATAQLSNNRQRGMGSAASLTFQRLVSGGSSGSQAFSLFVERRSKSFSVLGSADTQNPFNWEAGGGYSRSLTSRLFAGVDGRFSRGRGRQDDLYFARGTLGYRLTDTISLAADLRCERDNFERRVSGLLTATVRLSPYSTARGEYDSRFERARLSYSTFRGQGVGAYNFSADIDQGASGSGVNVAANYFANRAEIGFSHYGTFDNMFGSSVSQRSSVRIGSSIAFADGAVSAGRPIYDSFAIVRGHRTLSGASVKVEPTPYGHAAETGALGVATHPNLPAYLGRTVTVEAPDAPLAADLGQGTFRILPAYRTGYLLTVGSDFNVTAVGRLLNGEGTPVPLASGTASLIGDPSAREPVALFTNREGRFGISGLGPGRWLIRMNDEPASSFIVTIGEDSSGVISLGEVRPSQGGPTT